MFHATIAGTGRAVPEKVLTNAELTTMVDTSDEWITSRTGIRERRMAGPDDILSDFCVRAANPALEAAGVGPMDLDTIILATCTPDHPIPGAAPGIGWSGVHVARMIVSRSIGPMPAASIAEPAARTQKSDRTSPSWAIRRSRMPVRDVIHSSDVSTIFVRSAFVRTLSGTALPVPAIVA